MTRLAALPAALALTALLSACVPPAAPELPLLTTLNFTAYDAQQATLGLRAGKSQKLSLDAEPEYIAVSADSRRAYVTLQESNAVATVDLTRGEIVALKSLGYKNHTLAANAFDASDRDGGVNLKTWPVLGAYMPDAIASLSVGGRTYLLTANEGDTRDYGAAYLDEVKVSGLTLDAAAFPNGAALKADAALGRLVVSKPDADTDGDGDADRLVAFGARSLSVWNADLGLVADTGNLFEAKTAELSASSFNSNGTASTFDTRSDNKGPEPEGVATGVVAGRTLAFVGLERTGGLMVLDVSTPAAPAFVDYRHTVTPAADPKSGLAGDLAPEGLLFIPAADSPSGKALLVASHEVSGSVTVYAVEDSGKLTLAGRYQANPYAYDQGVAEISAYDKGSKQLFVVNGGTGSLDILNLADVAQPRFVKSVSLSAYGRSANSVAVSGGVVAVAVEASTKTDPGKVAFLNPDGTERAPAIAVGAQPDMLTFSPDGKLLLVANEGEPSADYSVDPAGSVSLINVNMALTAR
ncbi:choice-of-anchor I family protein [Deinococcus aquaedulcis]|uniref:choice-of-anchor I family protein n=1 Tax=Deinococcus aquaedulcis TaxID=2840455 RepID=UPI002E2D5F39|nr:choice-of-anchor I family protein [Deinococcus aquaedulcis]